jgi:Lysylphosphatidylglycerol synthase TM region
MPAQADSAPDRTSPPSSELPLWRRVLPFVVGGALVAYVAQRLDFAAFVRALRRTNYVGFVAFALAFTAVLLLADVFATTYVYRRTVGPVKFKELFVIRAAAYLPSMVNHHVGQAWLTYFLSKAYRAPISRAAGATLVVYATTFGALFAFLLVGLPLNHHRLPWLSPTVAVVSAAGFAYAVALAIKPPALASRGLLRPLFEIGLRGHLAAVVVRLPHVFVQFLGAWIPFSFFGVDIPFTDALALMPVLMFVVTLPVSPQGLGTRDALSLALFSTYAPGVGAERASTVAATTLTWLCVLTVIQLAFSPLFMRRAYQLLGTAPPPG